jgi:hypothetical protein
MNNKNMAQKIIELIESDTDYQSIHDTNLKYLYENSLDKETIDFIFIVLCGYSFKTILENKEAQNEI